MHVPVAYRFNFSFQIVLMFVLNQVSLYRIELELIWFFSAESISKPIKHRCWPKVLKVLCRIARSPVGFQLICETFTQTSDNLDGAVSLFIYGLSSKGKSF